MAQAFTMTLRRAALYIGGASLLAAWFSSAASISLNRPHSQVLSTQPSSGITDHLAAELQEQRRLLRHRLAAAPVPQQPLRNPFAFRTSPSRPRPTPRTAVAPAVAPHIEPLEPLLTLIGIAERTREAGTERTAMIATAGDQLILAIVGDVVLQRYRVTAISADVAELSDLTTGRTRSIALQ